MFQSNAQEHQILESFSEHDQHLIILALEISAPVRQIVSPRPRGIDVALILKNLNAGLDTVVAAILCDPLLRDRLDHDEITAQFGIAIGELVKDVNWLNTFNVYREEMTDQPTQAETLRRMLLSMTRDVRAVLIKLAFRICRLKTLPQESYKMRHFIAHETLDIYAPIANRLGIAQLKWELEDLAFRYLEPTIYLKVAKSLSENRKQRENIINGFSDTLTTLLAKSGISAKISGRPKHIYSIWLKMQRKQLPIEELYDLLAVRVIVDRLSTCYLALGIVHEQWQPIPKEFDDYIANPKENGYQSLHTVILDEQGHRIEVQIRTSEMHEFAELGVAAHWRYKEGNSKKSTPDNFSSIRQLLAGKDDNECLIDDFKLELFSDKVYVITPEGKLVELIKGATPLDFAYSIHTEIGHRCRGSKVNGRIAPLTYTLISGDKVEILTAKNGEPNRNWMDANLGYLKTPRAMHKVKAWFRQQDIAQHIQTGKHLLQQEIQKFATASVDIEQLCQHFSVTTEDKLFAAIGRGEINSLQLASALGEPAEKSHKTKVIDKAPLTPKTANDISVEGLENILTQFANCCNPIPGDGIIGFISQNNGIIVHRSNCPNINRLNEHQQNRLINVNWGHKEPALAVPVIIKAYDKQGLINDVTRILDHLKINILDARYIRNDDMTATLEMVIQVSQLSQLDHAFSRLQQLSNILQVIRK